MDELTIQSTCIKGFIRYPIMFLRHFADTINYYKNLEEMNKYDLIQLKGLVGLDVEALKIAMLTGIHPISGCPWDAEIDQKRLEILLQRNFKIIAEINNVLAKKHNKRTDA